MTLKTVYGPPPADEERIEVDEGELESVLLEERVEPALPDGESC